MRPVLSFFRFAAFCLLCVFLIPPQFIVLAFTRGRSALFLPWVFQYIAARLYGLKVVVEGTPLRDHVLFIGNHLSYLDIIAMGQCFPVSFVAKSDVAAWPLFGLLSKLQRTVYVERRRSRSRHGSETLSARLAEGLPVILFGEGTSTNGDTILPFKSTLLDGLFKNELKDKIQVQPFTLTLERVDGRPVTTDEDRDLYTWHGDMTLPPHLTRFGGLRGAVLRLTFHPPRKLADYEDRKALAQDCHADSLNALPRPLASLQK